MSLLEFEWNEDKTLAFSIRDGHSTTELTELHKPTGMEELRLKITIYKPLNNNMVEPRGIEPLTFSLRTRRSAN